MGIQKRHKYIFIGCEYLGIVVISILGGILFGAILSEIIKIELEKIFANIIFTEINYGFSAFPDDYNYRFLCFRTFVYCV